ncbi:MAG: Gfo/Idh/MocA family oxidoreductase, partial [Planctomycetes bacterium]|nr:Gfo/Idh/MocA family oxidoreductase [Planctomycetota bacterium]
MNSQDFLNREISRRRFLGSSAVNAAGVAAGMVGVGMAENVAKAASANRVSMGVIGVRGQGKILAGHLAALPNADVAAICDVDEGVLFSAAEEIEAVQGRPPRRVLDFRRLLEDRSLDAVVIATPDHWHALMTIQACQAEKDVYVESPVSHTVREGEQMIAAARSGSRIVQSGLQQRSGTHFQSAVEFVKSGRLGPVRLAKAWVAHRRTPIGFKRTTPVPAGVDYDLWPGPAAARPVSLNRFPQNWRRC